ncbi:UNVERIFIED_CONTAM: Retrovirus-related Pol polyprotein from transposon RE1 [Sesamum radiatum]|uniref:Retrovirus-related Pol polyprotein from transposon RE1 n=1 Tax=Sesamum radiatum TaxID=300843 RepID=A0AAW2V231_SESRA
MTDTSSIPVSSFTPAHIAFIAVLSTLQEPHSYKQAQHSIEWVHAMQEELQALEHNKTWELSSLPPYKKPIGCKWVYKIKMKPDDMVKWYKARLVAKGYSQIEGVDYVESFSPVAKAITIRILLSVASAKNWPIHQLDINNAFLHDFLDEDIYMTPPEGYSVAPGQQSQHDHYLIIKHTDSGMFVLLVYVDDVLLTRLCESSIVDVQRCLDELFTIKDLGYAKFFLGLEIAQSTHGTLVT